MEINNESTLVIGLMTYNYGIYIEEAINSILCQDFNEWRLIISDDNSADDTEQRVKKYLSDPRIEYIKHTRNLGQAGNWRYLLTRCNSEFFVILHADDYWVSGILSKAIRFFKENKDCDLIYFNWKYLSHGSDKLEITGNGPNQTNEYNTGRDEFLKQMERFSILPSSVFIRSSLIKRNAPPDLSFKLAVDAEYLIRLVHNSRMVKVFNDELLIYRVHGNSASDHAKSNEIYDKEKEQLALFFKPYFANAEYGRKAELIFRNKMSLYFQNKGINIKCDRRQRFRYWKKAFVYNPYRIFSLRFWLLFTLLVSGNIRHTLKKIG